MRPSAVTGVVLLPVGAGLLATALPAFGYWPAIGANALSLAPWRALCAWPGAGRAILLTLWTGCAATLLAAGTAILLAYGCTRPEFARMARRVLPGVLATPHAALAIGLAFLVAPSGWIARLASPWLTGWATPPDLVITGDPWGLALIAGLWIKEAPFLLLMLLAALGQAEPEAGLRVAMALGYGPARGWLLAVLPRAWRQMRLPALAVLAFSCSAVEVALVLGPSEPPTLAVLALRLMTNADFRAWLPGSAAAVLLCAVTAVAGGIVWAVERCVAQAGMAVLRRGWRGGSGRGVATAAAAIGGGLAVIAAGSLLVLLVWSFAGSWRFPAAWPEQWSAKVWSVQGPGLVRPAVTTLLLGVTSAGLAVALAVTWLQGGRGGVALAYVPLLVPQAGFVFGLQNVLAVLGLDSSVAGVVWAHLVYTLPYAMLALADPWAALDGRYARAAACLGASPWRVLRRVVLPLLARPLLAAGAVAFAVSAGLYLPTLFAGGGRWDTLTLEAIALASGGDRRVLGATALLQAALPLAVFAVAVRR